MEEEENQEGRRERRRENNKAQQNRKPLVTQADHSVLLRRPLVPFLFSVLFKMKMLHGLFFLLFKVAILIHAPCKHFGQTQRSHSHFGKQYADASES